MYIQCPKCEFGREVPEDKIPSQARKATCPKCGARFVFRPEENEVSEPPAPQEDRKVPEGEENIWSQLESMGRNEALDAEGEGPDADRFTGKEEVPWENLEEEGFFPGFFGTIKKAMLSPAAFFSGMPRKGLARPLVFYLILTELQAVATFIWQMMGLMPTMGGHSQEAGMVGLGVMGAGSVALLVVYPVVLTVMLFVVAGINHLLLKLCGAGSRGFEGTFRVVSYGNSPMILGVIPFLGPMVGGIWALVVTIVGYKNMHATTYGRVILAFLLPFIAVVVLIIFFALLGVI
ncbi:MAG: YIP1 family protein [Desulfonatronovibrionaceae bacterium]